jgi:hypothetical protein
MSWLFYTSPEHFRGVLGYVILTGLMTSKPAIVSANEKGKPDELSSGT